MTTTTLHRIQDERIAGTLALVLAAIGLAFANFVAGGENGGLGPYAVCLGVCAVLAAVLFGRVLTQPTARDGWILGGLAFVSCVVVWSGLPFVLGMAALYAGSRAGKAGPAVLGGVVIVLALVGCVIG